MSDINTSGGVLAHEENNKLGMWIFLGGEVVFFASLIMTFLLFRLSNGEAYLDFQAKLSIPIIAANTFVLIASSYMVVRSLEAIREGGQKRLRNNLLGVLVLGALFLSGQAIEWTLLFRDGISIRDTFGTPFFTVTGIHGTHVFVGLIWGLVVLASAVRGAYSEGNHRGVEIFGLYWHFVDIVWIVLFTLFYLI
ncbi:MAG: heme-copper oxidase subunit III [Anaerolineales bacterium]|jgi:heme/copper-type cytochrome/quinol oxidase subunit 3